MKEVDYYEVSKTLAKRYKVPTHLREDLIQEGYLVYLEEQEKGVVDHETLVTKMRKAMHVYANYKGLVVTIPHGGKTVGFNSRVQEEDVMSLGATDKALWYALSSQATRVAETEVDAVGLSTEPLEGIDIYYPPELTAEEREVFEKIAVQGFRMQELATNLKKSRQWVGVTYKSAVKKLRDSALYEQQL